MAIFNASGSNDSYNFFDSPFSDTIIDFASQVGSSSTAYSWLTSDGHLVIATGAFTYPSGNVSGVVTDITINFDNDGDTEVNITNIASADITVLISGMDPLWAEIFGGSDDTFTNTGTERSSIAGDFETGLVGGNDTFNVVLNGGLVEWFGDSKEGSNGGTGGNDIFNISGSPGSVGSVPWNDIYGDVSKPGFGGTYTAGTDTLNFSAVEGFGGIYETFFYGDARTIQNAVLNGAVDTVNASASDLPLYVYGEGQQLTGNGAIFTIVLNGAADIINGSQGTDYVYGEVRDFLAGTLNGAGDDIVTNAGDDLIYGDAETLGSQLLASASFVGGDDDITAGSGNDQVWGDFRVIEAGAAITSITFGNDTINGNTGDDQIWGDYEEHNGLLGVNAGGMDTINGGNGDDEIDGGGGDDNLDGGADNDTASYDSATSGVSVSLAAQGAAQNTVGAGNDTLNNFENLRGSDFNDTLTGDGSDNSIEGGDGDDTLTGGSQGSFGDTLSYEHAGAAVTVSLGLQGSAQNTGGAGNDTASGFENLRGSAHNDSLVGDSGDNVIEGGDGNDTINGGGNGFNGDTASYEHASSGVTVTLSTPGFQQDTVGAGLDTLTNIENLIGSGHADMLSGSIGANHMDGGDGVDTVSYDNAGSGVTVLLSQQGTGQNTGAMGTDTLVNFENILGSDYDDLLGGDGGDNVIDGGAGNNTVTYAHAGSGITLTFEDQGIAQDTGSAGTDTLIDIQNLVGSDFNDTIFAHDISFAAVMDGGDGVDTLDFSQDTGSGGVSVDLGTTSHQATINASVLNFENVVGGSFNDEIGASVADNVLDAGDGVDLLHFDSSGSGVTVSLALQGTAQDTSGSGIDTYSGFENLRGSALADNLTGDANANEIEGGNGNDIIEGGDGNDQLEGGAGIDLVSYAGASAGVTVDLSIQGTNPAVHTQDTGVTGLDWLREFEGVIGSAFGDVLTSGDNLDPAMQMFGGAGDDFIRIIGTQAHVVDGGDGSDTLDFSQSGGIFSVAVDMVAGTATYSGTTTTMTFSDIENIIGGVGQMTVTGNAEDNIIEGGTFSAGAPTSADILDGGGGNDTASYWNQAIGVTVSLLLQGTSQNTEDGFQLLTNFENLLGSTNGDKLTGDAGDNVVEGGDGNDVLDGGANGVDGDTASYSRSTTGVTVSLAAQGVEQNTGGAGNDTLTNFENLIGSAFNDMLTGDSGDNIVEGGAGSDTMNGGANGAGGDTASYSQASAGVTVSLAAQGAAQNTGGAGTDTLSNFENLIGSQFNDTLTGNSGNNVLFGGRGQDVINGNGGVDTINGDQGNDTINGGAGNDILDGGAGQGQDTIHGGDNDDTINGRNGVDFLYGDDGNDIINGQNKNDVLEGGSGDDTLSGNKGNDTILGGADNDTIYGGASADTVSGDAGDDDVYGGGQADLVYGGSGDDTVDGGSGNDYVSGGSGNDDVFGGNGTDQLFGNKDNDLLVGGEGNDVMTGGDDFDVFQFNVGDIGDDTILDFTEDFDTLEFTGGITAGDITIASAGAGGTSTLITVVGYDMTIWLDGVDSSTITTGDDMMFV